MQKAEETILEIDLGALAHNYKFFRSRISKEVKLLGVVKASAYGSADLAIALKLQEMGIDYLGVAYVQEGVALRKAGIEKPVLVLHPQPVNYKSLIDHCLEPTIYSRRTLNEFIAVARQLKQESYPIHLKLNTGLNRLGLVEEELDAVLDQLLNTTSIKVKGVFSHLAASEDWKERDFTLKQINAFRGMGYTIVTKLGYTPILHLNNTSAIINYPEAAFNMVRAGLGLYGFANDPEIDKHLMPVGTLKTVISQIQNLKPGDTVGYNRAFKARENLRIATLPLGHADGIKRQFGNERTGVTINGQYAPIIGNVCMDILMINITGIDCNEGDEVIVFGPGNVATDLAKNGGTISYELITGISPRVKRVFIEE
ncbi:hypothetical protein BH23BAC2_BH23BAC2_05160 [soil metagenome]